MSINTLARLVPVAVLAAVAPASAQNVFSENFANDPSTLTLNAGSAQTTFNGANGNLRIAMVGGFEASSAYTTQTWANNDFTISATLSPSKMLFTSGWGGVYAYGNDQFDGNGFTARVTNVGFTADDFRLELVSFGTVIAQSAVFDLVQGFEDAYTTFTLSLSGTFINGDLSLSALLTPISNPNNLSPIAIGPTTVTNPNLLGTQWGIRQIKAGNEFIITYDDLTVSVIPEPSSFAVLAGLCGLALAGARRRR